MDEVVDRAEERVRVERLAEHTRRRAHGQRIVGTGVGTNEDRGQLIAIAGEAPVQIPASRVAGGVVNRTRPLCPYPQVATYRGTGSIDEATNFECRTR